ncbi:MAG: hypothetical protein LBH79_02575 [Nitrososphaerota archaeon]|jgi:hypothetical protein|nr:hypothetical protein [Nitrososphaerota archaeon]
MSRPFKKTPLHPIKIERLVYIPQTVEENQKSKAIKTLAQKENTTQHNILDESLNYALAKRGLNNQGQPHIPLLSFGEEKPQKHLKCYFPKCKTPAQYQAYQSQADKTVGLCKEHAQALHKSPAAKTNKAWPWKNLEHLDAPNQSLCDMCVEVSTHTMLTVPNNRAIPLCDSHYHAVQNAIASGNTKWREPAPSGETDRI